MSMMVKMVAELKSEIKGVQARMDASLNAHYEDLNGICEEMREVQVRTDANHNALIQELNTLKTGQPSRSPIPRSGSINLHVPEGKNGREGNYGWQHVEENGWNDRFEHENGWGDRFRHGHGENEYVRGGNHHGRVGNYGGNDWRRRGEHHGGEPRPRFDDPSKSIKYTFPEFNDKFDPEAYLE